MDISRAEESIKIRVKPEFKSEVERAAQELQISLSAFVRMALAEASARVRETRRAEDE